MKEKERCALKTEGLFQDYKKEKGQEVWDPVEN